MEFSAVFEFWKLLICQLVLGFFQQVHEYKYQFQAIPIQNNLEDLKLDNAQFKSF